MRNKVICKKSEVKYIMVDKWESKMWWARYAASRQDKWSSSRIKNWFALVMKQRLVGYYYREKTLWRKCRDRILSKEYRKRIPWKAVFGFVVQFTNIRCSAIKYDNISFETLTYTDHWTRANKVVEWFERVPSWTEKLIRIIFPFTAESIKEFKDWKVIVNAY